MEFTSTFYNPMHPIHRAHISLIQGELWTKFHQLQTEMIITKTGRRMFPAFNIAVANLDPDAHYCIFLELNLATKSRYKYSTSHGWSASGVNEAPSRHNIYMHPESPAKGHYWMTQTISFSRLKLRNSSAETGHLVLNSMHMYQPRVVILQDSNPCNLNLGPVKTAEFPETRFLAVTAYQNDMVTKLKIDFNPFAKGFRENGRSGKKRRRQRQEGEEEDDEEEEEEKKVRAKRATSPTVSYARRSPAFSLDSYSLSPNSSPLLSATNSPIVAFPYPVYPSGYPVYPRYIEEDYQVRWPFWGHTPCYHHNQLSLPPPVGQTQRKITDFSINRILS